MPWLHCQPSRVTTGPAKAVVKTTWTLNGATIEQAGDTYTFDSTGRPAGVYKICATATSKGLITSTSCQEVTVVDPIKPINTLAVAPEQPSLLEGASTRVMAKSDLPANVPATYSWTINGQKQSETGPTLTFDSTGNAPGIYEVCSTVSAPNYTDKKSCTQIEVKACGNPVVSLSPGSEINSGASSKLTATPQTNACGSPVTVTLKASEGSIAPDGTFDSTGVAFDKTTPGIQRKTVTITANATDTKGRMASASSTVTVKFTPLAQRMDDIVFAAGSSRVNNCGKRLLLEVLSDKLKNDPNAQAILIGHMDKSEKLVARRGRKVIPTAVDHRRVLNVAAVLSAGTGICPSMDLSRVKVGYAGTADTSAPMLDFCGTSTVVKGGKPDTRIGYRRVEVWFVPGGANMPASSVTIQDPSVAAVKALGCPR